MQRAMTAALWRSLSVGYTGAPRRDAGATRRTMTASPTGAPPDRSATANRPSRRERRPPDEQPPHPRATVRVDRGRRRRRGRLDRGTSTPPSWPSSTPRCAHALDRVRQRPRDRARTTSRCPNLHDRLADIEERADQRPRLRAPPRHRPPRVHPGRDGGPLLGHRHPPRPAVGAEQARPRARRRHRPETRRPTTRPRGATSSAASRCRSTATAPTSSA